jgi:hypothetical protein
MKTKLLCLFFIAFSISAHSQKTSPKIEGAWKMVYYETINGDKPGIEFPGKVKMDIIKIWSGNQFMMVGQTKIDTTVSDGYGSGTFTLDGNKYVENVKILFYKEWEGKTIKMTMEMKSDTLIITYPVDENGKVDKDWAWKEKYVRIKK